MKTISVAKLAARWGVTDRTIRNYCASGKIPGAYLVGKTWHIPSNAKQPARINQHQEPPTTLAEQLRAEKAAGKSDGLYVQLQLYFTYHSTHLDRNSLTWEQTNQICKSATIQAYDEELNIDDMIQTANHLNCMNLMMDQINYSISEPFMKNLHRILKNGTRESRKEWYALGGYKKRSNKVGRALTTAPEDVPTQMQALLESYNQQKQKTLDEILDFHAVFERIHPFQSGNGCVGRLLVLKECLRNQLTPFIIPYSSKRRYTSSLRAWPEDQVPLRDLCLAQQAQFQEWLDHGCIPLHEDI